MRKIVCIILASLLLCLTACGGDTVSEQPTPPPALETVTPDCAEPTPVPTATPEPTPTWSEEPAEITFQLEGERHTVMGFRYTSPLGYSMIYDPDWVRPEMNEGYDHYTAVTEVHIPELYMRVTKTDKTAEQVIGELKAQGAEENAVWLIGGYRSVGLSEMSGLSPSDVVVNYYVTQVGESVYLLETSYFWEAAAGFGARMLQMLNTIQFTDVTEAKELKLLFRDKEIKDFTSACAWQKRWVTPAHGSFSRAACCWKAPRRSAARLPSAPSAAFMRINCFSPPPAYRNRAKSPIIPSWKPSGAA